MSRTRRLLFVSGALVLASSATGCFGESTTGDEGVLEFSLFADSPPENCFFGCRVDFPLAVSAPSQLFIDDDRPDQSFTINAPDSVEVEYEESFHCEVTEEGSPNESRWVGADEPCAPTEVRTAERSLVVTPMAPGEARIEVQLDGAVLDSITLEAREIAGIAVYLEDALETVDRVSMNRGETKSIAAVLLDADGQSLYCSRIDAGWSSDDDDVVLVDGTVPLFGFPTHAELTAEGKGTTTVRFEGKTEIGQFELTVN